MLARSRSAWDATGASRSSLGLATYATEASTSQSGRKQPQIERAIRIKSQKQKQSFRQDSDHSTSRPFDSRQKPHPFDSRQASRPFDSRQTSRPSSSKRPDWTPSRRDEKGSVRELRFSVAQKLNALVKNGRRSPDTTFAEGLEIFDSISGFTKRESRIYNAMIRLALRAGKRQWAIKAVNEMKKNGVAPSAVTYRSIFEGMSISRTSASDDSVIVQSVHDLFSEFEEMWRSAQGGQARKISAEEEDVEWTPGTSTAKSYAASRSTVQKELVEQPAAFDVACLYYYAFLLSIKEYEQAAVLLARVEDLASPRVAFKSILKRTDSKLPYLLSSRYLFELLKSDPNTADGYDQESVLKAYKTVMTSLREDKALFSDPFRGASSSKQVVDPNTERREIDKALHIAMSVLVKYDIPNRHSIIGNSLQDIYETVHLASLPPITIEKTIRAATDNIKDNPSLVMRIFESALDFNDGVEDRFDDKSLSRDQIRVNSKDVSHCWTKALSAAVLELKDLQKTMDLIQRAKTMRKSTSSPNGTSRMRPDTMIRTYIFSKLMRLCLDKQEWNNAVQVWRLFFDGTEPKDQLSDLPSLQHFFCYFFGLACKMEKDRKGSEEVIKYSRTALVLLEKDFGLDNAALWQRCETILKVKSESLKVPMMEEQKEDPDVAFCVEYLSAIRLVCRAALETGEQGVDLADKEQVEKWKELRKRATQLRNLADGSSFDDAEADWLRSGAKGKKSLALTDADMRELLG